MTGRATDTVVLDLYEAGMTAAPVERAAMLNAAAGGAADALLGAVDRRLWTWLAGRFSGPFDAVATCSACGAGMEFSLPEGFDIPGKDHALVKVRHGTTSYDIRMPRLADLRAGGLDPMVLCPEAPWEKATFRKKAEAALETADPGLRITLSLECGACGAAQAPVFDVGAFVWGHVESAAQRLIRDVAVLARAFGWSESEIAAMSPARRALYLREIAE